MPTTKTISVRHFRENMSKYLKETEKKKIHFVVMRHSVPVARLSPASPRDSYESLVKDIAKARQEVRQGKTYSTEEVNKILGL